MVAKGDDPVFSFRECVLAKGEKGSLDWFLDGKTEELSALFSIGNWSYKIDLNWNFADIGHIPRWLLHKLSGFSSNILEPMNCQVTWAQGSTNKRTSVPQCLPGQSSLQCNNQQVRQLSKRHVSDDQMKGTSPLAPRLCLQPGKSRAPPPAPTTLHPTTTTIVDHTRNIVDRIVDVKSNDAAEEHAHRCELQASKNNKRKFKNFHKQHFVGRQRPPAQRPIERHRRECHRPLLVLHVASSPSFKPSPTNSLF